MPTQDEIIEMLERTYPHLSSGGSAEDTANQIVAQYAADAVMVHVDQGLEESGQDIIWTQVTDCIAAIPDIEMTHSTFSFNTDGTVETQFRIDGTHSGEYRGVQPSNRQIRITGREKFYLTADQALIQRHEIWSSLDTLGWEGVIVG